MSREPAGVPLTPGTLALVRSMLVVVGLGICLYLGAMVWTGWDQVGSTFNRLGWTTLTLGAAVASLAYGVRFVRWHFCLARLGYRVPLRKNFAVYLSGLALTSSPGKVGETVRSVLLLPHGVKVPDSLGTFLADRMSDVLGVCLLGVLASLVADKTTSVLATVLVVLVPASFLFRWALTWDRAQTFGRSLVHQTRWLPIKAGSALLNSWATLWTAPNVLGFMVIAMAAYGLQACVFAWFCFIVGIEVSFAQAVLFFVNATLFGAASMIPGGLGVMEAALVVQLVAQGADQGVAISVAIATRIVTFWLGLLLGFTNLLVSAQHVGCTADPIR